MVIENFIGLGVLVIVLVMASIIRDLIKKHLESIDFKFKQYAEAVNTLRTELEALRIEHNKLPCAIKKDEVNSIVDAIKRRMPRDIFGSWGMQRTSLYDMMVNNERAADDIDSVETLEERIIFISNEKLQEILHNYTVAEKFEMANIVSKEIKRRENIK